MIASRIGSDRGRPDSEDATSAPSGQSRSAADPARPQIRSTRRMIVIRTRSIRSRWFLMLAAPLFGPAGTLHAGDPDRRACRITRYDIATRDDLLLAHLVAPAKMGDRILRIHPSPNGTQAPSCITRLIHGKLVL